LSTQSSHRPPYRWFLAMGPVRRGPGHRIIRPQRECRSIARPPGNFGVLRCRWAVRNTRTRTHFGHFAGDCLKSETQWRREGDSNHRDPFELDGRNSSLVAPTIEAKKVSALERICSPGIRLLFGFLWGPSSPVLRTESSDSRPRRTSVSNLLILGGSRNGRCALPRATVWPRSRDESGAQTESAVQNICAAQEQQTAADD